MSLYFLAHSNSLFETSSGKTLIKPSSVIPSEAELPVFGQFREVEEPAFVLCEFNQSFPSSPTT